MSAEKPYRANVLSQHLRAAALAAQMATARPSGYLLPIVAETVAEALLRSDERQVSLTGTNGHRATIAAIAADKAKGPSKKALLAAGETTRLAALLKGTDGPASLDIRTEAGIMSIETAEHSLEVILVDPRSYPDVLHNLASGDPASTMRFHPDTLSRALNEIGNHRQTERCARDPVYLHAGPDGLTIRHAHADRQKTVEAQTDGDARVAVAASYLADALRPLSGGGVLKMHGPEDLVQIRSAAPGPPSLTQYLMPLRTKIEFD